MITELEMKVILAREGLERCPFAGGGVEVEKFFVRDGTQRLGDHGRAFMPFDRDRTQHAVEKDWRLSKAAAIAEGKGPKEIHDVEPKHPSAEHSETMQSLMSAEPGGSTSVR